jgi:hypothetical protein
MKPVLPRANQGHGLINRAWWVVALAASVAVAIGIPAQAGAQNLEGTWSCCSTGGAAPQTWIISSGSGPIEGVAELPSGSVFGSISGTLSANHVHIIITYNEFDLGYVATFDGTVSADGNNMSGTWKSNQNQSGTMTATRLSGSPQYDQSVSADLVSGRVGIKTKGTSQFHFLSGPEQIPIGSVVDTSEGRVRLTSSTGPNKTKAETAEFYGGTFTVLQPAHGPPTTELDLAGFQPGACRAATGAARRLTRGNAKHNSLWGDGHGNYVTKGHAGSATVRGTIWLTEERCDGTFIEAKRDTVVVHDFTRHRAVTLHTGQHYLALGR